MPKSISKYTSGSKVQILTKSNEKVIGTIMPNSDNEKLILKLSNGYNIGIAIASIKKLNTIPKDSVEKTGLKQKMFQDSPQERPQQVKPFLNKSLKTISILHTGGTIASSIDYETGAVISRFTPEEIISKFPELTAIANIKSRLIKQMFSDDMRFAHYNLIAKEIAKEIALGVDGVIVTHGTDTMHYTAAALSFIFEGLPIPVILVGAQRSSDRGSSDAAMNLICAAKFIASKEAEEFGDVAVCMHKTLEDNACIIIPGVKARKMHTSRRDAFKVINGEPFFEVDYRSGNIKIICNSFRKRKSIIIRLFNERIKVGILKIHTQMFASQFLAFKNFNGLVIEGTGLGHAPISKVDKYTIEHTKIFSAIKFLAKKMPVAMVSQTIFGRVDMNVYSPGRELLKIGIIGNYCDMHPETAFIKLSWLLSNYKDKNIVRDLYNKNLRGEISERSTNKFLS